MKLFRFIWEFDNHSTIVQVLRQKGLLASQILCDVCGQIMTEARAPNRDGLRFRCNHKNCRKEKSIRSGSFFEKAKLTLCECMLFLHLWCNNYSEKLIIDDFNISNKTLVDWSRFCRDLCVFHFETSNIVIGGPGCVVEIDESLAVRRKYNRGRILAAGWLFWGIQRASNGEFICFMRIVYDRSEEHLIHIIRQHVAIGTHIITDGWPAYRNLSSYGYQHSVVIHETNFISPENHDVHTQKIEATWCSLKRFIKAHGTNKGEYYIEYICEYLFRREFKNAFEALLNIIRRQYRIDGQ